jgi:tetratricopeptide (TPR) repeat protein
VLTCLLLGLLLILWGCAPKQEATPTESAPAGDTESSADEEQATGSEEGEDEAAEEETPDLPEEELQERLAAAQEHLDNGEWNEALAAYDELAELAPGHAEVWLGRGVVARGLAQPEEGDLDDDLIQEAIDNFGTAIELDDTLPEAYYERAMAHSIVGRRYAMEAGDMGERGQEALASARADFRKSLELNPDDAQALLGRAEVYEALGDFYNAIKDFERVLDLIPGNTTAQEGIARCEESLDE